MLILNKDEFLNNAKNIEKELIEIRRFLHKNAEVGFELTKTVEFVKSHLADMGYNPEMCGKSGIVATVGKGGGKTILLRADMDALPVTEETEEEFASRNGNFHGCGHDMHTAMLLGAAKLLKTHEKEINGTVKLMFQPAEEILSGSKNMIENGVLENPRADCAIMLHVMAGLPIKTGVVIVSSGGISAPAADYFSIVIKGKGCHGSMPQEGVDALSVAAHTVIALQEISARELGVAEQALITIGKIKAGDAGNVIADSAFLEGTLRSYNDAVRERLKKRLVQISEGVSKTFRAKADVSFGNGCPSLVNNEELSQDVEKYLKELLGEDWVVNTGAFGEDSSKNGGSEDFSYISREIPSLMLAVAAGNSEEGFKYPQHHPKVKFDEAVLKTGAAVYAYNAIKWLENHK